MTADAAVSPASTTEIGSIPASTTEIGSIPATAEAVVPVAVAPVAVAPGADREAERRVAADLTRRVRSDSLWLLVGYGVTSLVGFAFWIVAARTMSPAELGIGTAHLGVVTSAAAIGATGIGDALLVMLPRAGAQRAALMRIATIVLVVVAVVAAIIGVVVLAVTGSGIDVPLGVAILVGTMLWSFFVIKDNVLQGVGLVRWTLYLNGPANIAKLGLLPLLALAFGGSSWSILLAVLLPAGVAAAIAWTRLRKQIRDDGPQQPRLDAGLRTEFATFAARAGSASGLYVATVLVLPTIVTAVAGPEQGALYALAAQAAATIDLVAHSFGSSFARHASADGRSRTGLVRVWVRTAGLALAAAIALIAVAPVLLLILGDFYVRENGWTVIALLAATSVVNTIITLWASSLRARRATTALLVWAVLDAILLVAGVTLGAGQLGAVGAAAGVLIVSVAMSSAGIVGLVRASRVREVTADVAA